MPLEYINPNEVTSPKRYVENLEIIHDGGNGENGTDCFSIARLTWEGEQAIGIRWNVARNESDDPQKQNGSIICKGLPISHGKPVWFVLPTGFLPSLFDKESEVYKKLEPFL